MQTLSNQNLRQVSGGTSSFYTREVSMDKETKAITVKENKNGKKSTVTYLPCDKQYKKYADVFAEQEASMQAFLGL